MREKISAIIGLNLVFPLLFGSLSAYAETSGTAGSADIAPSLLYVDVLGDNEKFEEDHWVKRDVSGGVSDFNVIKEFKGGDSLELEGRAIAGNSDYLFNLDLKKEGLGDFIFEFKQFRKYYDGTGGYYSRFANLVSFPTPLLETERDLFLDIGELKFEGVFSKDDSTKCVFSYEREYRKGAKSLTSWGSVVGVVNNTSTTRKILPTFLETDEIVDKLELKIEHTVSGIDVSAEQSWEKIRVQNQKANNRTLTLASGLFSDVRYKYEDLDSDIYTTILRVSKELNEKTFFSTAFLYTFYRGHTRETITDQSTASTNENHPVNPADVLRSTITVLPKLSFSPLKDLLMDAGLRWEFVNKNGAASYDRDRGTVPDGNRDEFLKIKDEQNENKLGESLNIRYDGIKNVALYAGADLEQQLRNETNTQDSSGALPSNSNNFLRITDIASYDYEFTSGLKWHPMPKVDITTEVKYGYGYRDYGLKTKDVHTGDITNGYRGFIRSIAFTSYEPIVIFNFKPFRRATLSFRYALDTTIYGVRTEVAPVTELNKYTANIYSSGVTLTPCDSLYLTFFYHYKEAETKTQANGDGGKGTNIPTYNANVKALSASCSYSPVKNVTVRGSYSFSKADNFNDFSEIGLPLGLDNLSQDASIGIEGKIREDCSLEFKYDFTQYDELSNSGINDYEAHLFYTALKAKF